MRPLIETLRGLTELGGTADRGVEWHMRKGMDAADKFVAYAGKKKTRRALLAARLQAAHNLKILASKH